MERKSLACVIIILFMVPTIVSTAQTNKSNDNITIKPQDLLVPGHIAFGWAYGEHSGFIEFYLDDPGNISFSEDGWSDFASADFDPNGNMYLIAYEGGLYLLPLGGSLVFIASTISGNGLCFDTTTATWYVSSAGSLYTMDILTGATTYIGSHGTANTIVGIACDNDGNIYGYDVLWTGESTLYSINKSTGVATAIGSMGYGFLYAQDPAYDRDNNILYIAGYFNDGSPSALLTCDTQTGSCTIVGTLQYGVGIDAFAIPYGTAVQYPYAQFTWEPPNPYPEETVRFNASASYDFDGYITLYEWDWNDDSVYEEAYDTPTAMHSWTFPGSYTITLRVTDDTGFTGRKSKIVDIINQPPEKPIINGPVVGRAGVVYNFTVVITDPGADQFYYLWDWGDGDSTGWLGPYDSGEYVTFSHAGDNAGTYLIQVKAKNSYGEESNSDPFAIQIVELKKSLIIGSSNHQSERDDLRIIDTNFLIIVPSDSIVYYRVPIVIAKNYRFGFLLPSLFVGIFEAALLNE